MRGSFMIDCLLSRQKDRLNAERLVHLPAVPEWYDFNDCHTKIMSLSVRLKHERAK